MQDVTSQKEKQVTSNGLQAQVVRAVQPQGFFIRETQKRGVEVGVDGPGGFRFTPNQESDAP